MPEEFLVAFKQALEDSGTSYRRLGELIGAGKDTVGLWVNGDQPIWPDEVFAVEHALDLPPGTLSQLVGYVPVSAPTPMTVIDAVDRDPKLNSQARRMVKSTYRAAIER